MKVLKAIGLGLLGLLAVLAIGGYLFFRILFTPEANHLELTESSGFIPINWKASAQSDMAVLFLPVQIEGIPHTFYVQFDTGSPSTLLYRRTMQSIREQYPDQTGELEASSETMEQAFYLGDMRIYSDQFALYDRGRDSIDWKAEGGIVIGTLGADLIDQKITLLDFEEQRVFVGDSLPPLDREVAFQGMKYKMRKVMLPGKVAGRKRKLLHDTGTSGFDMITNERNWKKMASACAEAEEAFKVRSWKKQLTAYNIATDESIQFGAEKVDLDQVTYVRGTSFLQQVGMRLTGMGGMIGNQLFRDRVLILDCPNERYALLKRRPTSP